MAGKKGMAATKTAGTSRQANLLFFYKKRSETTVDSIGTTVKEESQLQPQYQSQSELQYSSFELRDDQRKSEGGLDTVEVQGTHVKGVKTYNSQSMAFGSSWLYMFTEQADVIEPMAELIQAVCHESDKGIAIKDQVENGERGYPRSNILETRDTAAIFQNSISSFRLDAFTCKGPSSPQNLPPTKTPTKITTGRFTCPNVIDLTSPPIVNHISADQSDGFTTKPSIIILDDISLSSLPPLGDEDISPNVSKVKTVHPFFAQPSTRPEKSIPSRTTHTTNTAVKLFELIWPDADCQHTIGPQSSFWTPACIPFIKRQPRPAPVWPLQPPNIGFLKVANCAPNPSQDLIPCVHPQVPTSDDRESIVSSLPDEHRSHPGFSRFLNISQSAGSSESGDMWSHKWRPRKASEVLGNEDSAVYLKTWLNTLALRGGTSQMAFVDLTEVDYALPIDVGGTRRPDVVRVAGKMRARKRQRVESDDDSDMDQWIADNDIVESSASDSRDDIRRDWTLPRRSNKGTRHESCKLSTKFGTEPLESYKKPDFSILTNTILLVGPPGSGKTSTVYACAEELGWEVFEIYPGIGKRSGLSISSLIGDVGTNHLVGSRRASTRTKHSSRSGERNHNVTAEDGGQAIRQSIIVLEEVDIMFKDDANFWPALVNIIKYSHRPVVLTCNDASLIPPGVLPLQTCLHFQPCPTPLALSLLQCVCLVEGRLLSRKQLEIIYVEKSYTLMSCDEPDQPLLPFPSQAPPCPDMRRSLNHLQFWSIPMVEDETVTVYNIDLAPTLDVSPIEVVADWSQLLNALNGSSSVTDELYDFDRLQLHSDCSSYVDAYLERRPWDVEEALAIDRYGPSGDDELGHPLLCKSPTAVISCGLAFYNRDTNLAHETLDWSRHVFETAAGPRVRAKLHGERGTTRLLDSRSLTRRRVATQVQVVSFLDDVISRCCPLLPRPAAVLDYTPYVRQMIIADDVMEVIASASAEASQSASDTDGRRRHRRRRTEAYVRHLEVSEEGRQAARETCFE